jgi:hypothetical protein
MTTRRRRSRSGKSTDPPAPNHLTDLRHFKTRKNNSPSGEPAQSRIAESPRYKLFYNPHSAPVLSFCPTGQTDHREEFLVASRQHALIDDEIQTLTGLANAEAKRSDGRGNPQKLNLGYRVESLSMAKSLRRDQQHNPKRHS